MIVRVQAESVWRPLRRALADVLILAGSAAVLVWAWALVSTALYQRVQKTQFESTFLPPPGQTEPLLSTSPVSPTVPSPALPVDTGTAVPTRAALNSPAAFSDWFARDPLVLGEIEVPRLDLSVIVREGMDDATLRRAAGHVPRTALPGEPGNFVVLGHRDTLFRPLRGLEKGDNVRVRTAGGEFSYRIDSIEVVPPENVELGQGSGPGITLVTCFPFDFVGPAPRRFVARGHLAAR